jgi:translation initiation factor 1 (eIF-1/SUI1)
MTHSLHRTGSEHSLKSDYVILAMLASGYNDKAPDARDKMLKIADIMKNHNPVNILTEKAWRISSVISASYDSKHNVKEVLEDLKKEDFGISIVVEGLINEIKDLSNQVGLKLDSAHLSLGMFGKKNLLPDDKILEITTMCGHHCISPQSVKHYVDLINKDKISIEKAAEKLAKPCICGIFNTKRAIEILKDLT